MLQQIKKHDSHCFIINAQQLKCMKTCLLFQLKFNNDSNECLQERTNQTKRDFNFLKYSKTKLENVYGNYHLEFLFWVHDFRQLSP